MADKLADYAQEGGAQNEQDIAMIMQPADCPWMDLNLGVASMMRRT
eukprot:COSAG06_NODE_1415_length_9535_cov_6.094955_11_plen_46_part_00